jgi:hypothetical protein
VPGLTLTVVGQPFGTPIGPVAIGPFTVTGTNIPETLGLTVVSGPNTIAVPSGSVGWAISPPSGNTQTLAVGGASGDTGVPIPEENPSVGIFGDDPPANIYLIAGGNVTGVVQVVFW